MIFFARLAAAILAMLVALPGAGLAQGEAPVVAKPAPWEVYFQPAQSPIQQAIIDLHDLVLVIITLITLLVGGLLVWAVVRYNARRHPNPGRTSHNTVLEISWTVIPVLILVIIAIPSFRLVYYQDRTADPELTVKVTAHQWNWEYSYPDNDNLSFTSYIVPDEQLQAGQLRLLAVDNQFVLPVGKNIRILITSSDVIHSFFIPSLGVQRYAIPGRTLETWVRLDRPGVFYGQCNQICGTNHSRMPIAIRGVPEQEFTAWLAEAKTKFSDAAPTASPPVGVRKIAELQH